MCREEIRLKATINVKFKNIYQARNTLNKNGHSVDIAEALGQLQYSSIQVVTLRIIGGCFGNNG